MDATLTLVTRKPPRLATLGYAALVAVVLASAGTWLARPASTITTTDPAGIQACTALAGDMDSGYFSTGDQLLHVAGLAVQSTDPTIKAVGVDLRTVGRSVQGDPAGLVARDEGLAVENNLHRACRNAGYAH